MRKTIFVSLIVLTFSVVGFAHAAQSKSGTGATGTWSGAWTGGSTGKFELTIKKGADGKLSALLAASPDQGDPYTVQIKSVEANGSKLTLKFEDPNGEVDITLQAVIEGSSIKGDYSVRAKAGAEEVDKGTFTAARK